MLKTVRMNAYRDRGRAMEEANGLTIAFSDHPLARRTGFDVSVIPYQGEYHVNVTADVDTSNEGFLSVIIARALASKCRAPSNPMQIERINGRGLRQINGGGNGSSRNLLEHVRSR